jgi:Flp pilus assembly protein TadB
MNDPFNPIPIPENLNLTMNAGTAQEQASPNNLEPERSLNRKPRRKSTKAKQPGGTTSRAASASRWHRIKGRLAAKVAQMDKEKLKALLLAAGVAAGIVAAVILAIKLVPVAAVILAILGLGVALRFWERLRYLPCPF